MNLKKIALVAHDSRKKEMIEWATYNAATLSNYQLFATGTTARLLQGISTEDVDHLDVTAMLSGPLGGDQQIGTMIAQQDIDMLIFFCDNLAVQGHQNDVSTPADLVLTSSLINDEEYTPKVPSFSTYINRQL